MTTKISDWNIDLMKIAGMEDIDVLGDIFKAKYSRMESKEIISLTTSLTILSNIELRLILDKMNNAGYNFNGILRDKTGFFLSFYH